MLKSAAQISSGVNSVVPRILPNEKFKPGDTYNVTVQEVDEEYKKIILMIDLGLDKSAEGNTEDPVDTKVQEEQVKVHYQVRV